MSAVDQSNDVRCAPLADAPLADALLADTQIVDALRRRVPHRQAPHRQVPHRQVPHHQAPRRQAPHRCGGWAVWRLALLAMIGVSLGRIAAAQGYAPLEAEARMSVPAGFRATMFAAEPLVRQPVAITFDDRGRLWVIQYLQYPNPAGLERVEVDRYSRTRYDRVPEPPPHGPRGADRITILEDTTGDGRADRARDFVDGLNLATGLLHGDGGLYVLQAPYLLFYADHDRDDVPDGPPRVVLSGFGLEDAHALANSLCWGPDGWLYGAQGSTVTAHVRGHTFQQGIWRYHPPTDRFELFAEGGGNTWGVDFDSLGQLIAGTNHGGYAMLHQVPHGNYWKQFSKHGALQNPHAYGYLEHVPYADFRGGHVTCGGIVYQGDRFPEGFAGRYIAANLLSHAVYWHELEPAGSTFRARHGGELLVANDTWFAPVDVELAPDGSIYVADWHDARTAHPDPDAEWDRSNGRIVRIDYGDEGRPPPGDLSLRTTAELIDLVEHPNAWYRRQARRLLAERRDPAATALLGARWSTAAEPLPALDYLWTLHATGGLDLDQLASLLSSERHPAVRLWAVRLASDDSAAPLPAAVGEPLIALARDEPDARVRSQLASSAQRLPPELALPIVAGLITHDADAVDQHIPLLIWWAIERHAAAHRQVRALADAPEFWQSSVVREHLLARLARRYAATGSDADWQLCAALLGQAPDEQAQRLLREGIDQALRGRRLEAVPAPLATTLAAWAEQAPRDTATIALRLRLGDAAAEPLALAQLASTSNTSPSAAASERVALIEAVADHGLSDAAAELLLDLVVSRAPASVREAALAALARRGDLALAARLLAAYPVLEPGLRPRLLAALAAQPRWAGELVAAVESGRLASDVVTSEHLAQIAAHGTAALDERVAAIWGRFLPATPEEKLATVRRFHNDLRAAPGDARQGQRLFREHCGTCHRLFGEGETIGPDLTSANRGQRDWLLVNIVDPSTQVRVEYLNYQAVTHDGRIFVGLVSEEDAGTLTLVDAKAERTRLAKEAIASIEPAAHSLMPEGILEKLTPTQLRDLFAYLEGSVPPVNESE